MSDKKPCPAYPVRGLIISGDPTPTAKATGCGESSATGTQVSPAETPGRASLNATGAKPKTKASADLGKPGSCSRKTITASGSKAGCSKISSEAPLDVTPSTSKAAQVRIGKMPIKPPVSGTTKATKTKVATPVPVMHEGTANKISGSQTASPNANTANSKTPRHVTPARRAFLQRRSAAKILARLAGKPVESLSKEDKSSLEWAKGKLAVLEKSPPLTSKDAPKRQRSEEETNLQGQQPGTKRPKPLPPKPHDRTSGEVVENQFTRAVIDRGDIDGAMSPSRWDIVRKKLMGVFWEVLKQNPGPPPQCEDGGWFHNRVKLMACSNERSALLLKQAVSLIKDPWEGAKLEVVSVDEIPRRPRSTAIIPAEPHKKAAILELLQVGNPDLPTQDWKVVRVSQPVGSSRRIVVILNQESLAPLREKQGKVYYGFESIFLRVYRGDDKGLLEQDDPDPDQSAADMSCDETDLSLSQSTSKLVKEGEESVDEDDLLASDKEDANVTVLRKDKKGDGESNPN
ncbi:uncharacterized protein LOC119602278 [Lucilia sericata]|uniref:uncharacterized protein LOC119602278 n=1 Tax=Lucilia sericata TaxID=13632 RepID=UPI0018A85234|nr:uncharacterized protein LOC119602278 [Lucilia sericata]